MKRMKRKLYRTPHNSISYKSAGVDVDAGNEFIQKISPLASSTQRPGTMSGLGGFGALFDLKAAGYSDPIIVAATDGVGTKLKIAIETGSLKTVGIDLVAMCVNDLICQGAEPLFFLDYFATAKLNMEEAISVIEGIAEGCKRSNISLIGGETAEMPGMYRNGDFDLAGFAIGALNRGETLPKNIKEGDIIISVHSSGIHSNGLSLARMVIKDLGLSWQSKAPFSNKTLGTEFLEPTKIYAKPIIHLIKRRLVNGLAHITGGGLTENIPRILNETFGAKIDLNKLIIPDIFKWLFKTSKISQKEALKTFNCGTGMILIVNQNDVNEVRSILNDHNEPTSVIGEITRDRGLQYTGKLSAPND